MELDDIQIRGAREHNLRGVDVDIPKKRLVVFTGVSGSGKSSLAFDTLYAEGQRRYVESLSSYARQFLGQMEKPRYDTIRGLTPTISIEQKAASKNPRSTVGTITEIHDYLRVLYARVGVQHCHSCGKAVGRQSAAEIVSALLDLPDRARFMLLAPLVRNRKGAHRDKLDQIQRTGYTRVRVDGEILALEEVPELDKKRKHTVEVVLDRLIMREGIRQRLTDSVEAALKLGSGVLTAVIPGQEERIYSELLACHDCGLSFPELTPQLFSFNNPQGMCPDCNGLGFRNEMDPRLVVPDTTKTLHEGAVVPWQGPLLRREGWNYQILGNVAKEYGFDLDTPWKDLSAEAQQVLLYGAGDQEIEVDWSGDRGEGRFHMQFEGIIPAMARRLHQTRSEDMRKYYLGFHSQGRCRTCNGARLRPEAAAVRVGSVSLVDLTGGTVAAAHAALGELGLEGARATIAEELVKEISNRLRFLMDVGLEYLTLDRTGPTLSGGESQRIRLASQVGSELTGVTYVLDEPSIGLHQRDNRRLLATLGRLRDIGNTVVVVEHDRETIEQADYVVDFGPGAGHLGGEAIYKGTPAGLLEDEASLTGQYLSGAMEIPVPPQRREPGKRALSVVGARENNLQDVDVTIPLGLLVAVTGVSGAGKSSMINRILSPALHNHFFRAGRQVGDFDRIEGVEYLDKVVDIDQSPIGRTPRSNPVTYTKVFDHIRKVFTSTRESRIRGYKPGRFSFNVRGGRCEACSGDGYRKIEMHFLADVYVPCEICKGKRFNEATLEVKFRDHNIAEVLDLTVDEGLDLFSNHRSIRRVLKTLSDVGLGYIKLGQPSNTLSGGEAQRVKLSRELAKVATGDTLYLLDEPTTGLHFDDIRKLMGVLERLVDAGNTVLVIEHNLDVIKCADHVIDLGPEGGHRGGRLVAEGPPEFVATVPGSHTGRYLKAELATS
jgi:excinuclease ABC subunit A